MGLGEVGAVGGTVIYNITSSASDYTFRHWLSILKVKSHSVVSNSLLPCGLYSPWNSLGQNTGVGSLSLLQRIFPTQESNPGLPHCRQILYQLSHKGSPRILEWIIYPFSSGSSWPRNRTRVSHIAVRFFTNWANNLVKGGHFLCNSHVKNSSLVHFLQSFWVIKRVKQPSC